VGDGIELSGAARTFARPSVAWPPPPRALVWPRQIFIRVSVSRVSSAESARRFRISPRMMRAPGGVGPSIVWSFPNKRARARECARPTPMRTPRSPASNGRGVAALKETEQSLSAYGAELDSAPSLGGCAGRGAKGLRSGGRPVSRRRIDHLDLLTTEQSLISIDASVAVSDTALVQDQIAVFKALGRRVARDAVTRRASLACRRCFLRFVGCTATFEPDRPRARRASPRSPRPRHRQDRTWRITRSACA